LYLFVFAASANVGPALLCSQLVNVNSA